MFIFSFLLCMGRETEKAEGFLLKVDPRWRSLPVCRSCLALRRPDGRAAQLLKHCNFPKPHVPDVPLAHVSAFCVCRGPRLRACTRGATSARHSTSASAWQLLQANEPCLKSARGVSGSRICRKTTRRRCSGGCDPQEQLLMMSDVAGRWRPLLLASRTTTTTWPCASLRSGH